ncbi:FmdB family zinc ribbon protein [Arthrobacter luteolus]|uniref:FmdB family zinc ribbon protein n=1 Tax=Arthrobacter luteolus TaxID=98672 RepID=UPI0008378E6E|nr:FmdB family zinc ribbon protein [Arthrobacter luteolus]
MPTYAYACKDCGHAFDIQQSFTDDSLTVCPECGGNLRKKFNSVGVVFKGSGFYRTDSRDAASTVPATPAKDSPAKAGAPEKSSAAPAPAAAASSSAPAAG